MPVLWSHLPFVCFLRVKGLTSWISTADYYYGAGEHAQRRGRGLTLTCFMLFIFYAGRNQFSPGSIFVPSLALLLIHHRLQPCVQRETRFIKADGEQLHDCITSDYLFPGFNWPAGSPTLLHCHPDILMFRLFQLVQIQQTVSSCSFFPPVLFFLSLLSAGGRGRRIRKKKDISEPHFNFTTWIIPEGTLAILREPGT